MSSDDIVESSVPVQQSETVLDLPRYCNFNKFFLVEELALEQNYQELHFGKCSLLGKLRENSNGNFELENIQLRNLPKDYSLPEGSVSIRLLSFDYRGETRPQNGRFCEIAGEVVLVDVQNSTADRIPLTARGVCEQLAQLDDDKQRKDLHAKLLQTHKPAVRLFYLNEIDRAGDLAERNLEIRMLSESQKA